jgi:hypothetical protein
MRARTIEIDRSIKYPEKWTPIEFACKCGVTRRVDVEVVLGFSQSEPVILRAHCSRDEEHLVPGRIIRVWEER